MDQHTSERRMARCYGLWAAATNYRRHNTDPSLAKTARRDRIKTNAITTAANVTYYGGTLGAGLGFYNLLDQHNAIGIVALIVFTLTVEGVIGTLLNEVLATVLPQDDTEDSEAASPAKTQEATR